MLDEMKKKKRRKREKKNTVLMVIRFVRLKQNFTKMECLMSVLRRKYKVEIQRKS